MTASSILMSIGSGTGVAATGVALAQSQNGVEPWWIAAILVPLAAFAGGLVHWILRKHDEREALIAEREERREAREEKRTEHVALQTAALQQCVDELQSLNRQHIEQAATLAALPDQIVNRMQKRPPT